MNKNLTISITIAILIIGGAWYFTSLKKDGSPPIVADTALKAKLATTLQQIPTQAGKNNFLKQSNNLTADVDPELVDLDSQITTCGANIDDLAAGSLSYQGSCVASGGTLTTKVKFLGGQCCGTLTDTSEYHENLKKLQAYKDMPDIILNPFHTPVALAKQWIDYDNATQLTPQEQAIYDQAYAISKEKPCCCKCWHYFVNEGIAKKMIKDKRFNAQQIADYWDASDICGT